MEEPHPTDLPANWSGAPELVTLSGAEQLVPSHMEVVYIPHLMVGQGARGQEAGGVNKRQGGGQGDMGAGGSGGRGQKAQRAGDREQRAGSREQGRGGGRGVFLAWGQGAGG